MASTWMLVVEEYDFPEKAFCVFLDGKEPAIRRAVSEVMAIQGRYRKEDFWEESGFGSYSRREVFKILREKGTFKDWDVEVKLKELVHEEAIPVTDSQERSPLFPRRTRYSIG